MNLCPEINVCDANKRIDHLRANFRITQEFTHGLDKRLAIVETEIPSLKEDLTKIASSIEKMQETLQSLLIHVNSLNTISLFKNKVWIAVFSIITLLLSFAGTFAAFGLHEKLFK